MGEESNELVKAAGSAGVGAVVGASAYGVIGGVGVVGSGVAFGLTIGPFVVIGAVLGAGGYGLYWLGKQKGGSKSKN